VVPSRSWVPGFLTSLLLIVFCLQPVQIVLAQSGSAASQPQAQAAQSASGQAYSLPPDKLAKAKALNKIRLALDIGGSLWGLVFLGWLLASRTSSRLERWVQRVDSRRWIQGLLFFLVFLGITSLASLPLDAIGHTVSRHYGISVQGWAGWLGDQGKALGVSAIAVPVLLLFNWIVRRWPRRYWLGAWIAILPLMVLATMGEPLLEPLFNKYEPLQKNHAGLIGQLERVVARTGTSIPPDRMFLMKASEKTNGLNAYVSGLGATKRIVVWDTTAGRIPDDDILYIFGHESGHYVLHHIVKGLIASAVFLFFVFAACAHLAERMVRRFGERWGIEHRGNVPPLATRTGFVTLILVVSVVMFLLEPMGNTLSRYFEHQADVYGQEAIHGLVADPQRTAVSSFNYLGEAWLEDPDPNPFVEFWLYSHPSVQNRARFAEHYNPWANGGHGQFFQN
jgi:Zn-dependent protease with chaperone function